jgi:NPCBM/NEW2 domain
MRCQIHLPLLASVLCLMLAPGGLRAQFTGAFADGSRFRGAQLAGWPDKPGLLRVKEAGAADKAKHLGAVFDAKNPVAWLYNEQAEAPAAARPGVELFGGDRLPGQVVGYRYGTEQPTERQPAHLLVKLDSDAVQSPHSLVRVRAQAVRRVIWRPRRSDRYTPATLYLLDDRQISFRAVRWTAAGVTLLLGEGGTRRFNFGEIAELHLPRRDPWQVYQEMLAVLSPDCSARLLRIETTRGLILTGTMERSQVSALGHILQPAWCLEPIGFPHPQLRWWRFYWPHEVPLSLIEPLRTAQRSPLEGARAWQVDRNVKQQPLHSGGKLYASGFGMQSFTELEFELPATVRGFRALVGMDEQAARSGCGQGRVYIDRTADKPLWQSKVLVGSGEVTATGRLPLKGPAQGEKTLTLIAEAPTDDRPAGADPLNIRSFVDWLEPEVELDLDQLRAEVQKVLPESIPAWQGWTVSAPGGEFRLADRWENRDLAAPRYRRDTVVQRGSLRLMRQLEVGPNQNFLCLSVSREPNQVGGWAEVRVDGRPRGDVTVPPWERTTTGVWLDPPASFVPLAKYRGKTVTIEVEYHPAAENGTVEWRSLDVVPSQELVVWTPVEVIEARAATPATRLVLEPEHTIFAATPPRSKPPRTETYTIVADTKLPAISAIRLELLPDPRLASQGPGRADGQVFLSEFTLKAAPRDQPDQADPVTLTAAGTEHSAGSPPAAVVDGKPETAWHPLPAGRPHVIVFTAAENIAFPGGARLTFSLQQDLNRDKGHVGQSPGRFRLLVTDAARPVPVARPGSVLEPPGRKTIFEDEYDFVRRLNQGAGVANLETKDRYSGSAAIRITPEQQCLHSRFLGEIRIRREPGRGEFRYLQFAWKKSDGGAIGLQLANNGKYGPEKPGGPTFRYHAGPYKPWGTDSLVVSDKLPAGWVLVTRDLFADFGEFTLTGLSLDARGGSEALYDHIRLGRTLKDFEED